MTNVHQILLAVGTGNYDAFVLKKMFGEEWSLNIYLFY